jgi:hypothetical protein
LLKPLPSSKHFWKVPLAMALKSDITIDATKFDPASISEQTAKLNDHLIKIFENAPKWYEVSPKTLDFLQ